MTASQTAGRVNVANRLTIDQAADYVGQAKQTLYQWRGRGVGPQSYKLGSRIYYDLADLDAYVEKQKVLTSVGA
ncbi:helix-turn-helix transcriptional regulator [Rhodococcus qingshengii]|uniref:helix-turn-helix transcriptional regulator n=1 Tax=Rhodococcus qingshengii TaxID=334542 RepID=UPI001E3B744D|nr:helix-turn-helix domain-containing protein [Rhodococcus qingshengii]UGQ54096.1 helix-turn-helix domain-containing protein [Rhodococcus qingshengii]